METANLCQIPEANYKSTRSIRDPFATFHFADSFHLPSFDVVFDSELVIDKAGLLLHGIDEVITRTGNKG
jgi:hypothetical protein